MGQWLARATHDDLTEWPRGSGKRRGNGPFVTFLGVILHVNVSGPTSNGTPISYFENNGGEVFPNFQVYKDGTIVQFAPLNWQTWCQVAGNGNYAAIETGGDPDQPLTQAQLDSCAYILDHYHATMGLQLVTTDKPGDPGFGTHQMGGIAWGGHACPGPVRAPERQTILDIVKGSDMTPAQVENMIAEGLRSLAYGGDHGPFTHDKYADLVHPTNDGAYDRLQHLERITTPAHPGK